MFPPVPSVGQPLIIPAPVGGNACFQPVGGTTIAMLVGIVSGIAGKPKWWMPPPYPIQIQSLAMVTAPEMTIDQATGFSLLQAHNNIVQ
jgi:hypothetical protein